MTQDDSFLTLTVITKQLNNHLLYLLQKYLTFCVKDMSSECPRQFIFSKNTTLHSAKIERYTPSFNHWVVCITCHRHLPVRYLSRILILFFCWLAAWLCLLVEDVTEWQLETRWSLDSRHVWLKFWSWGMKATKSRQEGATFPLISLEPHQSFPLVWTYLGVPTHLLWRVQDRLMTHVFEIRRGTNHDYSNSYSRVK